MDLTQEAQVMPPILSVHVAVSLRLAAGVLGDLGKALAMDQSDQQRSLVGLFFSCCCQ